MPTNILQPQSRFSGASNDMIAAGAAGAGINPGGLFSTSPPTYRFHIGSAPTSSSSSPSSLVGNRLLFENRQNPMMTNNFGEPIMIDDLEEETILDVSIG